MVLEPEGAALLAAKVLAVHDAALRQRVRDYQVALTAQIIADDAEITDSAN